jgi:hypothetical protein
VCTVCFSILDSDKKMKMKRTGSDCLLDSENKDDVDNYDDEYDDGDEFDNDKFDDDYEYDDDDDGV